MIIKTYKEKIIKETHHELVTNLESIKTLKLYMGEKQNYYMCAKSFEHEDVEVEIILDDMNTPQQNTFFWVLFGKHFHDYCFSLTTDNKIVIYTDKSTTVRQIFLELQYLTLEAEACLQEDAYYVE